MGQHGANEEKKDFTAVSVIFNEEFNASVITDYEHRLIELMNGDRRYQLTNKNEGMSKSNYFSKEKYADMFEDLWEELDEETQWWPEILRGEWPHCFFYESRWMDLPDLYELGDIVRVLRDKTAYIDPAYDCAVVSTDRAGWEERSKHIKEWLEEAKGNQRNAECALADYSDMQIMVQIPCKDGTFKHDHINPMFLERVSLDAEGEEAEL